MDESEKGDSCAGMCADLGNVVRYLSESATSSPYFGKGRKTEGRKGQKGDEGSIAWRGPEGRKYRAADPYPTRKPSPRSDLVSSRQMGDHSVRRLCLMVLVSSWGGWSHFSGLQYCRCHTLAVVQVSCRVPKPTFVV